MEKMMGTAMKVLSRSCIAAIAAIGIVSSANAAGETTSVRVGQQPQRWALEWYIAAKKGWWKEIGLNPTMSTFSSGAPEIAAGASGSWDVGGAGDIPSVLGAARYGLLTIGIADEEAAIITIMALKDKADKYLKDPGLLKGKTIPVTTNSTGQWGAMACLEKKFGLKDGQYQFVNLSPPEINAAVSSGRYDVSEVWAPNTYILESTLDAKIICTGEEMKLPITSNLFATPEYAKAHPDVVAKFLAVYLRAVAWERAHPQDTIKMLGEFFKSVGVNIPQKYLATELHDRPAYTLAEQLEIFRKENGKQSKAEDWSNQVANFMVSVGTIRKAPPAKSYVTGTYLQMIEKNPKLKAFAENTSN